MKFPYIYDTSVSGKVKVWSIRVSGSTIITETGFVDGKKQEFKKEIKKGKNIGRSNETTPEEQATSEAQSKWNKKKDSGYSEKTVVGSSSSSQKILPMLALDYHKRGHDIVFPCFIQPKIDGIRGIFYSGALHSRMGKKFPNLDHINDELTKLDKSIHLDGEIYTDEIPFQELSGIVRKQKLDSEDSSVLNKVKFRVYDVVSSLNYAERLDKLKDIFKKNKFKNIMLVKTTICNSEKDVKGFHDTFVNQGYEGLMLRNFTGGYVKKNRSKDLQKFKEFEDDEFVIVGFKEGTGKEKGMIIFTCEIKKGKVFDVRPKGSYSEREKMWKNRKEYIGKKLTVRYFGKSESGTPRMPVGIDVRDYE